MMQKQTRLYLQKAGILAAVQSIWFCGIFCLWFFLFSLRG